MAITFSILALLVSICCFILLFKINKYLEKKIEPTIQETLDIQENLKQTFKKVLVEESFLLENGKLKKAPIEEERDIIINGLKNKTKTY